MPVFCSAQPHRPFRGPDALLGHGLRGLWPNLYCPANSCPVAISPVAFQV